MKRFCTLTMLVFPLLVALHSTALGAEENTESQIESSIVDDHDSTPENTQSSSLEEDLFFEDEELITGPTKRAIKLSESPANVTVITHEDIMQSGVINLGEVFRRVAGMDVVTIGAADTQVSARGFATGLTDGDRMSVLIDGRTFYLDFQGGTMWSQLPVPLSDIKRIEVIKGPMSSLYGNRAMLGIINIVTYEPEETHTTLSGGGGRFKMGTGNFSNAGKFADGYWYKVTGTYTRMDEFSDYAGDGDSKDLSNASTTVQFVAEPQDETRLKLSAGITQADTTVQFGPLMPWTDTRSYVNGQASHDFGKWGILDFQSYWERNDVSTNQLLNLSETLNMVDAELRHSIPVDITSNVRNVTTYGGNYRYIQSRGDSGTSLSNFAGFLQNETRLYDKVILTGGVRVDYQKDYAGTNTAAHGSVVWMANPIYTTRVGIATAFNTPTMINYFVTATIPNPSSPVQSLTLAGNQDLKAERIIYVDFSNQITPIKELRLNVDFFYYRLTNMIANSLTLTSFTSARLSFINDGGAEAIGGEIGVDGDICDWLTGYANWSYEHFNNINSNNITASNMGNPKNKFNVGFRGRWLDRITANIEFHYVQPHYAQAWAFLLQNAPSTRISAAYLLNARVAYWPIKEHLELAVAANNMLNDNAPQTPETDPQLNLPLAEKPQFNIWGSLRYVF